ncbi:hypothetical protein ACFQKF_17655 [Halalkalicoccus sp. GCM10025322]|uniref:hypothetical protein n=1 Tax=Halalkalicoccus TaxID=332246 RepID=UPI002F96C698
MSIDPGGGHERREMPLVDRTVGEDPRDQPVQRPKRLAVEVERDPAVRLGDPNCASDVESGVIAVATSVVRPGEIRGRDGGSSVIHRVYRTGRCSQCHRD